MKQRHSELFIGGNCFELLPVILIAVKPVLKGHIWDKEKVAYKTGDLLKEVEFI
jgi:hypothetical protein